jgi:L-alanine-DL-glutamate epimerase-like enolase superfamily enzyme
MPPRPKQLDIYRTAIPMRAFDHAAASRDVAEAIVVRLTYDDGLVGWGETLPRDYVTGESLETVPADIEQTIWPKCIENGLLEPSETPRDIPNQQSRRCLNAAACAVDLASLRRILHDLHNIPPGLLQNIAHRPRMRTYIDANVSGVLGSKEPARTAKHLRWMLWLGLTNFKLKLGLGDDVDAENLRLVHKKLRRGLAKGVCTLRVDVNGAWDETTAPDRVERLAEYGVCVVEQPVFCSAVKLAQLADKCALPLMADETLLTEAHAKTLLKSPKKIWWNLRISKNGGFLPTLRLMNLANQHQVPFTLGCMVGESAILSAAQRRLLQVGPVPRFVEGNYGRLLLTDDLVRGRLPVMFGYGGGLKTLKGDGLGVDVSQEKIERFGRLLKTLSA